MLPTINPNIVEIVRERTNADENNIHFIKVLLDKGGAEGLNLFKNMASTLIPLIERAISERRGSPTSFRYMPILLFCYACRHGRAKEAAVYVHNAYYSIYSPFNSVRNFMQLFHSNEELVAFNRAKRALLKFYQHFFRIGEAKLKSPPPISHPSNNFDHSGAETNIVDILHVAEEQRFIVRPRIGEVEPAGAVFFVLAYGPVDTTFPGANIETFETYDLDPSNNYKCVARTASMIGPINDVGGMEYVLQECMQQSVYAWGAEFHLFQKVLKGLLRYS